jgi:hypothetical protein
VDHVNNSRSKIVYAGGKMERDLYVREKKIFRKRFALVLRTMGDPAREEI